MKKIYLLIFLSAAITISYAQENKKDYTEAFNLIEVWLEAQKDYESLPGISAIVVENQDILWTGAFGLSNVASNVPTSPSTICSICSISKLFTSVAIMKLYDEGKLRLDDKVEDLLPWYNLEQQFPDSWPVTVRGLLTHSSGLPRESDFPYWTGPEYPFPTRNEIKSKLGEQKTLYPSSTYFQYSNLGLTLLGEIVEQVSGVPFDVYVQQYILDPLELADTRTTLPKHLYGDKMAIGYSSLTREGKRYPVNFFQAKGIKPAAGFSSNVLDLGKFAAWQFRLTEATETEIIKPSTLKYMYNVHWTDPDWNTTWGLGFVVSKASDGSKWISHGGWCPGFKTIFKLHPKSKRAYSVMINAEGVNPGKYADEIHNILSKVKTDTTSSDTKNRSLEEYTGLYEINHAEIYIASWQGQLAMLELPNNSPSKSIIFFKPVEGDTFRRVRKDGSLGEEMTFERDENGKTHRFKRHQIYFSKTETNPPDINNP